MFRKAVKISGNIVDIHKKIIYPGTLEISGGKIVNILKTDDKYDTYIIPGLVDAHIHIESSMLVPSEFARLAVVHGTVATVSDPHEITNVLGIDGVRYMLANGAKVPFKFYFGAPSCVPATGFETAGAEIAAAEIKYLFQKYRLKYLSEMMNFPGILTDDPVELAKIRVAKDFDKPIDGHAPGLTGGDLLKYVQAGISTDHEAFKPEEGREKIKAGMSILIREGSAAKNFKELNCLIGESPEHCMLCCDDKHPNELLKGHIDVVVKTALQMGYDKFEVLRCASLNPVRHYGLDVGLLRIGDPADLAIIDNFEKFTVLKTYIGGQLVAAKGKCLFTRVKSGTINNFQAKPKNPADFAVKAQPGRLKVIEVIDGELITKKVMMAPKVVDGYAIADPERDLLKIAVINRYRDRPPTVAFIKNFGFKKGAVASSVAHDSHNIIAIGVSDRDIAGAVNLVIRNKGGLAVVCDDIAEILPLPVAGLMSAEDGHLVAAKYEELALLAREMGSTLKDPFMTMSFMTLLVIPELKLSDQGLFDGQNFKFTGLFAENSVPNL